MSGSFARICLGEGVGDQAAGGEIAALSRPRFQKPHDDLYSLLEREVLWRTVDKDEVTRPLGAVLCRIGDRRDIADAEHWSALFNEVQSRKS